LDGTAGRPVNEPTWAVYKNIPQSIGILASSGLATLIELQTVYGVKDLYDLLEIRAVNMHNEWLAKKYNADNH